MPFSKVDEKSPVYDQLLGWLFSGKVAPGTRLVEQSLAREFGVSRIPIRESIHKMVAQGLLVEGGRGSSVRTRTYTAEDIRQLFEFRSALEGFSTRAAAANATEMDFARMEMICNEAEMDISNYGSQRWPELDHHFHAALAKASHNNRLIHCLKHLLAECHYVFYVLPPGIQPGEPVSEDAAAQMVEALEKHRAIIEAIRARDADRAEEIVQAHIEASGRHAAREKMALDLKG
jgi:DNA-binding GntR family transcriptional regulator